MCTSMNDWRKYHALKFIAYLDVYGYILFVFKTVV